MFIASTIMCKLGLDTSKFLQSAKNAMGSLKTVTDKFNGMAGMALPSFSIVGLSQSMISEAREYQSVVKGLATNLALAGEESHHTTKSLMELTENYKNLYGFDDTDLLKAAGTAANFGIKGYQLDEVLKASMALTKVFDHMDVQTAMFQVAGKGIAGFSGSGGNYINRLGAEFKKNMTTTERYAEVMKTLLPHWKKVEDSAGSLGVGIKRLTANWGDFRKEIGLSIINGFNLAKVYNWMADQVTKLTEGWQKLSPEMKALILTAGAGIMTFTTVGLVIMAITSALGLFAASVYALIPLIVAMGSGLLALAPTLISLKVLWGALGDESKTIMEKIGAVGSWLKDNWATILKGIIDGFQYAYIVIDSLLSRMSALIRGVADAMIAAGRAFYVAFDADSGPIDMLKAYGAAASAFANKIVDMGAAFDKMNKQQIDDYKNVKNSINSWSAWLVPMIGIQMTNMIERLKKGFEVPIITPMDNGGKAPEERFNTVSAKMSGAFEKGSKEAYSVEKSAQFTALSKIESNTNKTAFAAASTAENTSASRGLLMDMYNTVKGALTGEGEGINAFDAQ